MDLIDTLKEVFSEWKKWIIVALIVVAIDISLKFYITSYEVSLLSAGVLSILTSIVVSVLLSLYWTAIVKNLKIVNIKEAFTMDTIIKAIKSAIAVTILVLPIIILIMIMVALESYKFSMLSPIGPIESEEEYLQTLMQIAVAHPGVIILTIVWSYIISPASIIAVLKNSIAGAIKKFYKVSLTFKYFIELIKLLLFNFVLLIAMSLLVIIPYIGTIIVSILSMGVGFFAAVYLARVVKEVTDQKGI